MRKSKFYESVYGSGIFVNENGLGTFEDCECYRNKHSGIEVGSGGNPTVRKSKFYESPTGILVVDAGMGTFEECESCRNTHRSSNIQDGCQPIMRNNRFT